MAISKEKQVNQVASRGKNIDSLLQQRRRMMQERSLERAQESSSYSSGEEEDVFFWKYRGGSAETSSGSTSSRKRKGASDNTETRKLIRTVSANQEVSDETIQQHNVFVQGKQIGLQGKHSDLTRRIIQADITKIPVETELNTAIATDDNSDTTCTEKELLIQFLFDFEALFTDEKYRDYLRGERVDITKLKNFLRGERGCKREDLSSYEFTIKQYLTLEEDDLILEEGEKKKYRKPRSDCACGFKNFILENSTPAEFIADNFMFKNDNTSVCRHEISMQELLKLYRFLALDKSLSQEYIVAQIREAATKLCEEYGCRYFLYSFLQRNGGSEKTLQGFIDIGIVRKEDFEKYNVHFSSLLLPFLQTHPCLKILIEWYPEHLRPSDIVKSVQPNEKDSSVVSIDDFKLLFTLAIKHFPERLGFLLETDESQNKSRSGIESRDNDFHTSPCREICNMKTKNKEALEAIIGCLDEAGLSLSVDMMKELRVGRRREKKICDYIQKELCARAEKRKSDIHTKIPRTVENNHQSISAVSILQEANEKRTKKAVSNLSFSSKSQTKKRDEKVHTTSETKCPLVQDGNSAYENNKQDIECIRDESSKRIEKPQALVEICKKRNEMEYLRSNVTPNSSNGISTPSFDNDQTSNISGFAENSCPSSQFEKRNEKVHRASEDKLSITEGESNTSEKEKKDNTESLKTAEISNSNDLYDEVSPDEGGSDASILPSNHTEALVKLIKKLVSKWADEEISNGNKVFYWNIMSNQGMSTIASKVPLSIEELKELGVLGENIVKEYGDRLITNLNAFIDQNGLHKYIKVQGTNRRRIEKNTPSVPVTKMTHEVQASPNKSSQKSRIDLHEKYQPQEQGINYGAEKSECSETLAASYSPKQTCNEILRGNGHMENRPVDNRLQEMKEEYAATIRKKNDEIDRERRIRRDLEDRLRDLEDRLKSQVEESETNQMKKSDQINGLVTENNLEKSRLEEKQRATENQHYETRRKLTDQLEEKEERIKEEKTKKKRLVEENKSLQIRCKTLKSDNQKLVDQNKSLKESSAARMIAKKNEEQKKMKDRLQTLSANENHLREENEQLKQKFEEFEELEKFKSNLQVELECAICHNELTNPHMTKCGHRFCKTCIELWIEHAVKNRQDKACPICKDHIVSKRDLRKDEFIKGIVDVVYQDSKTEEEKQPEAKTQNTYDF
ncbi:hypothetical protein CTEN210_03542 [Chaetoceros tenuissimus]|uniref:RING-type E3 ubiquitin transferase n=1 Tax=Chaetoceros tenuissimus TaxID=426638 RepID=A0AAD3CJ58_9STRA|nr:hypothetical protein CTEN210_03542 [Chaetoceros tenuissimus]